MYSPISSRINLINHYRSCKVTSSHISSIRCKQYYRPISTTSSLYSSSSSSSIIPSTNYNSDILLDKFGQSIIKNFGLYIKKLPIDPISKQTNGRGLFNNSSTTLSPGEIILTDSPLMAVTDVQTLSTTCSQCFRSLSSVSSSSIITCSCGVYYCSKVCRDKAFAEGHDVLCNSEYTLLNSWCKDIRINYPRIAVNIVAKSISTAVPDFSEYWTSINRLASISISSNNKDEDNYPKIWTNGYRLVCNTLKKNMKGDVNGFFEYAFNMPAYVRLMGTLRLNSFSIPCPIDQIASSSTLSNNNHHHHTTTTTARTMDQYTTINNPTNNTTNNNNSSSSISSSNTGGCCSNTPTDSIDSNTGTITTNSCDPSTSACGSSNSNGSTSATYEAPGGTALYPIASFINHSCEPNLDVIMSPYGNIAFRTRTTILPNTELTITYLDSSTPVNIRRVQLYHSYGFECQCTLCQQQLRDIEKEKRKVSTV